MKKQIFAALAAAAVCAAPARAQEPADSLPPYRQVLSANPLGLLFTYYNAEYERAISNVSTLGLAGAYAEFEDDDVLVLEAKYRYYPQARALSGFSLGGSLGFGQVSTGESEDFEGDFVSSETSSAFILGIELDYNWLVGRDRRFFIGTGIGGRRLFGGDIDSDIPVVIPTIRLVNVGFAF